MNRMKKTGTACAGQKRSADERGFTLIETTIALLVMMIIMLGVASVFAFAVANNSNGADRAQTLAVAQQSLEAFRNLEYSETATHGDLTAGAHTLTVKRGQPGNTGRVYKIDWNVVDNSTQTLKTITINVTPITAGPSWTTAPSWATVTIVTQRAKTDQP
jgi:Tfp pilus assembly protein PilV